MIYKNKDYCYPYGIYKYMWFNNYIIEYDDDDRYMEPINIINIYTKTDFDKLEKDEKQKITDKYLIMDW